MEGVRTRRSLYGFEVREDDLRRRNAEGHKPYDIKALWQLSHEICSLSVQGIKQADIARVLRISLRTVTSTLNSELGMMKVSKLRETKDEGTKEVVRDIELLTRKAMKTYHEIFDNKGDIAPIGLRKATADTVMLEFSGHRVPAKVQSSSLHAHATLEEIEEFKMRGIKAAKESGMVIDVEPEDDNEKAI